MKKILISLVIIVISHAPVWADTYESKYNTAQWLPVIVVDGADGITLETGITGANITVWYKEGIPKAWTSLTVQSGDGSGVGQDCATDGSETPESGDWCEEDATNIPGSYRVYVPATVTDTKGKLFYLVKGTGYKTYWGQVSVMANTAAEDPVAAILDDTGTSGVLISDGTGAGQIDTLNGSIVNVDLADTCTAVTNGVTLADDSITAAKIAAGAIGLSEIGSSSGTVTTGSCDPNTTLTFDTDMTQAGVNHWKDAFITFKDDTTTVELRGQTKVITASAVNGCLTVKGGFTTTPQSGDTFVVINK